MRRIENCDSFNVTDAICTTCSDGYYLSNNLCCLYGSVSVTYRGIEFCE
jgi:hypothetical protein